MSAYSVETAIMYGRPAKHWPLWYWLRIAYRAALIRELTRANGSAEHSVNMADRIRRGELTLPNVHSEAAHRLARELSLLP